MENNTAAAMLAKVRDFVARDLNEEERQLFAALLAPGVALASEESEVGGFAMVDWPADNFPDALGRALRQAGISVTGLDP